jgi:hypothetical protein
VIFAACRDEHVEMNAGSHGMAWMRAEHVNAELVKFMA